MRIDYDDTHMPYNNPGEFENKFIAEKKGDLFFKNIGEKNLNKRLLSISRVFFDKNIGINEIIAKYDSAIFYDDQLIGKVIDTLEETGLKDNTYIFFFSDHGESFFEHGIYLNHVGLFDKTMNVPLIIAGPRLPKNTRINALVQLEDIVPTVLDLLDINYSTSDFDGESLVSLIRGKKKKLRDSIFMEEIFDLKRRGIRTERYKYIERSSIEGKNKAKELYDLLNDPDENKDLAENDIKTLMKLEKHLQNEIKNLQKVNEKRRINKVLSNINI